jgi:hypothetical protein
MDRITLARNLLWGAFEGIVTLIALGILAFFLPSSTQNLCKLKLPERML